MASSFISSLPISHALVTSSSASMSSLSPISSPLSDPHSPTSPDGIDYIVDPYHHHQQQHYQQQQQQEQHHQHQNDHPLLDYSAVTVCTATTTNRRRRLDELVSPPSTPSSNASSNDDFFDVDSVSPFGCYAAGSGGEESRSTSKAVSHVSRLQRNQAEKQRRDKLNICIGKLAAMVPLISMSTKRINKSGILRLTASYLRLHQRLLNGLKMQSSWRPFFSGSDELGGMLLETIDGFMVIMDESGRILFVSEGIEKFLGHAVVDVLGQPFRAMVHPDDQGLLDNSLNTLFANNCENVTDADAPRCSFFCSLAWNGENKPGLCATYDLFNVTGHLKFVPAARITTADATDDGTSGETTETKPAVEKVFVGLAKRCSKMPWQRVFSTVGPNEMVFRSCLNSRVTFVDQSLCGILGLMPSELIGLSGYGIIMQEDFPLAAMAHTQLLQDGYFHRLPIRLCSRFAKVIYVMSSGRLVSSVINGENDTLFIHSTVLPMEDGEKALEVAHSRITPYVGKNDMRVVAEMILNGNTNDVAVCTSIKEKLFPAPEQQPIKRPRGRPRKYPAVVTTTTPAAIVANESSCNSAASHNRLDTANFASYRLEVSDMDQFRENNDCVDPFRVFQFGKPVGGDAQLSNHDMSNEFLENSANVSSPAIGNFMTCQSLNDL